MTTAVPVRRRSVLGWSLFGAAFLLVLLAYIRSLTDEKERSLPSVVVLVTVDTLRADSVSFLGNEPQTTPFLDELADDGVVFEAAYSPSSWTVPSMASLFTGVAPASHGVVKGQIEQLAQERKPTRMIREQPALPQSFTTLAEAFQRAGYVTVGIPSNIHLADYLGFSQGFDHYYGEANFLPADQVNYQVEMQLREAFGPRWKTAWKEERVFLWIHYFDPHDPYWPREPWITRYAQDAAGDPAPDPANLVMRDLKKRFPEPDEDLARRIRSLYRAEINYVDEHLRRLDATLGLQAEDVLFMLTADHGEEIVDHGMLGHGHSLYEELVHVPMLIHWPAAVEGGRRLEVPVSLLDVYPTLAELKGLKEPDDLYGRSLAPLLLGLEQLEAGSLHYELDRPGVKAAALRRGKWKLVHQTFPENRVELFDLTRDPGEKNSLVQQEPELVEELSALLVRRLEALPGPPSDVEHVPIESETVLEQLRAFGYAGDDAGDGD